MEALQALEENFENHSGDFGVAESFKQTLARHGLRLERLDATTLQINVALVCNQACKHCHLEAGPNHTEIMDQATLDEVVAFAEQNRLDTIDITGGATELYPGLIEMIQRVSGLSDRLMVRSNLSALVDGDAERFLDVFRKHGVVIVASFPSLNPAQYEAQRGKGVFDKSIDALRRLNAAGYGGTEKGLELDLVSNPAGAFFPPSQAQAEKRFRSHLKDNWNIIFNNLFTFANVPLGRFRKWLHSSGNLDNYLERLRTAFNPCVVDGLMCRTLFSIAWDGYVYDCDFNLARRLHLAGRKTHISELNGPPKAGTPIAVADHCFTCTAGSGFT
jgi:radical SAM/Cys-rich protein